MSTVAERFPDRHPGTVSLLRTLQPNPNLPADLHELAAAACELGEAWASAVGDGPELTTALRRLREAKDCVIVQALLDEGKV